MSLSFLVITCAHLDFRDQGSSWRSSGPCLKSLIFTLTTSACSSKAGKPVEPLIARDISQTAGSAWVSIWNDDSQVEQFFLTKFKLIWWTNTKSTLILEGNQHDLNLFRNLHFAMESFLTKGKRPHVFLIINFAIISNLRSIYPAVKVTVDRDERMLIYMGRISGSRTLKQVFESKIFTCLQGWKISTSLGAAAGDYEGDLQGRLWP